MANPNYGVAPVQATAAELLDIVPEQQVGTSSIYLDGRRIEGRMSSFLDGARWQRGRLLHAVQTDCFLYPDEPANTHNYWIAGGGMGRRTRDLDPAASASVCYQRLAGPQGAQAAVGRR